MVQQMKTRKDARGAKAILGVVLACAGALASGNALAQEAIQAGHGDSDHAGTQSSAGPMSSAWQYVENNSYFQVGVMHFQYYGTSSNLTYTYPNLGGASTTLPGTGSSQGNKTTLGLTYGLYLPKTGHHLALEFALAPPIEFDFDAVAKTGASQQKIGTFKALPPNFSVVYRPWVDTSIQPYIGVGAMYLFTYDTHVSSTSLPANSTLYLSKPVACIGQLGADVNLAGNMFFNLDARYVGCTDVKSRLTTTTIPSSAAGAQRTVVSSTNHFKAVLYQISFGWRF